MKTSFDLSALDTTVACNKPFEVEIKHPVTGASTGIFITVLGKDSDAYKAKRRQFASESLSGRASTSLDSIEAKNHDALVAATVGWRTGDQTGKVFLSGEALDFNADNARRVYETILPIRDQVQEAINDLGNFMAG